MMAAALLVVAWLFTGIEHTAREHGVTDYELFVKQTPSFRLLFENTARCGECDLRPWALISEENRVRFAAYCTARFGLDQVRPCYAIFEEQQRMANRLPARGDGPP